MEEDRVDRRYGADRGYLERYVITVTGVLQEWVGVGVAAFLPR